ncbi:uncharacterized protein LOC107834164 [Poecilia formosa]|uniref:uncharacterized protein LOC107834164 n=1 Tax=Poecilia formosa TaxID=48698 RepID=UPI0007BA1E7F|nr:PREDICTED: uncharacterized protein LOC107834164 [Poecilia formosa]
MMPLCMVISWVYSVAMMIQHIVAEKEHRLKEVMKMMGLNNAVHWVAWFITGFVQLSISVTALTVILKYGRVLLHSDPLIIWLFLTIYAVATIMFWLHLLRVDLRRCSIEMRESSSLFLSMKADAFFLCSFPTHACSACSVFVLSFSIFLEPFSAHLPDLQIMDLINRSLNAIHQIFSTRRLGTREPSCPAGTNPAGFTLDLFITGFLLFGACGFLDYRQICEGLGRTREHSDC